MNLRQTSSQARVFLFAALTILLGVIVGVVILNPLWESYRPPFPMPQVFPAITAPIDGPFYLQNAEQGYQWRTRDPHSLWFHPLMSLLVAAMPHWLPSNIWFWFISLAFGFGCVFFSYKIALLYSHGIEVSASVLPLLLLVPGGLGLATGNAEIPTLFFAATLLLSVLRWHNWWLTSLTAVAAILTKPNALYMVPVLLTYAMFAYQEQDKKVFRHAAVGLAVILLGWLLWIVIVDAETGHWGSYWEARVLFAQYVAGDTSNFFLQLTRSFLDSNDLRDQIRYTTSLIIPLANLWIIAVIPFSKESHRYALASGTLAMVAIMLAQGNPNKIIVYTTTLPGYFPMYILLISWIVKNGITHSLKTNFFAIATVAAYCAIMLVIYALGTPQGWYY